MQATGRTLLTLQEVDARLAARRQESTELQEQLEVQAEIPDLTERAEVEKTQSIERRATLAHLETDVDALRERVEELEERIYGGAVTNLRELSAVEEEQTVARRALAQAEEALGPARVLAEESERNNEELTTTLAEREESWKEAEPRLRKQLAVARAEVENLVEERAGVADDVPPRELTLYDQLLFRRNGVAVAHVERGVCQACHITLPLRDSARLRRADALITCGNCGRILISV
jgi:hypothetical protein